MLTQNDVSLIINSFLELQEAKQHILACVNIVLACGAAEQPLKHRVGGGGGYNNIVDIVRQIITSGPPVALGIKWDG